jgi:hypothetical protein
VKFWHAKFLYWGISFKCEISLFLGKFSKWFFNNFCCCTFPITLKKFNSSTFLPEISWFLAKFHYFMTFFYHFLYVKGYYSWQNFVIGGTSIVLFSKILLAVHLEFFWIWQNATKKNCQWKNLWPLCNNMIHYMQNCPHYPHHQECESSSPSSAHLRHQVWLGRSFTLNFKRCAWVWEGDQVTVQAMLGTGGPRAGLRLCPNSKYASQVALGGRVPAGLIVANSEVGDRRCCHFSSCNWSFFTTVNSPELFRITCLCIWPLSLLFCTALIISYNYPLKIDFCICVLFTSTIPHPPPSLAWKCFLQTVVNNYTKIWSV